MPLGSRFLILFSAFLCFTNQFVNGSIGNVLSYFPYDIVIKKQIWRLLFSPLFGGSLVRLILSSLAIFNLLGERENSQGTILFLIELFFKSTIINILISLFYFLEFKTYLISYFYPQNGMWNLFFYYCAVKCQQNPEFSSNILITNIMIVNKYIPIIMILLFSLFDNPVGPIISTFLGFVDGMVTQGSPCRFNWVNTLELKLCSCLSSSPNFIKHSEAIQSNNYLEIFKFDITGLFGKPKTLPVAISSSNPSASTGIEMNAQPNIERMLAYAQEQQQPQDLL